MTDAVSRAPTSPTDRRLAAPASPRHLLRTTAYELVRPIVLFGQLPRERAHETGVSERTLQRKVARFAAAGMRKAIVELKVKYPPLSLREIAAICQERFARSVSHHAGRSSDGGPHDI
jgi:hypothetical protein